MRKSKTSFVSTSCFQWAVFFSLQLAISMNKQQATASKYRKAGCRIDRLSVPTQLLSIWLHGTGSPMEILQSHIRSRNSLLPENLSSRTAFTTATRIQPSFPSLFPQDQFNIILSSIPLSSKLSLPFRVCHQYFLRVNIIPHACYMSHPHFLPSNLNSTTHDENVASWYSCASIPDYV
jgi:hypothetical protein